MHTDYIELLKKYVRLANYISASQIYLQDNFLLERPLEFSNIKPRLLGHWGTVPGINFTYAHLNYAIIKHNISMLFVLGPGHGFPALQTNLFLEGTLQNFYQEATQDAAGLAYIVKQFSWPYGFPSHTNPGTPGAILEGGELGYSLSTAYGAVLDNPDLYVACLIGDGEAETGALAASWHLNKFVDPRKNGVVLPILHLNGYKISGPTIFGRMSNRELTKLFQGYGYQPIIVEGPEIYTKMAQALDLWYTIVQKIKASDYNPKKPFISLPMIILKTPKGWTGIKRLRGKKIEGNNLSHQTVIPDVRTDKVELKALEQWLRSYKIDELWSSTGIQAEIKKVIPPQKLCMGTNNHAYSGRIYKKLTLPDAQNYTDHLLMPGEKTSNSMHKAGSYLQEVIKLNQNFRIVSPDEIYSNKLDAVLKATSRAFMLPIKSWDQDLAPDGQVIEMLSEQSLQGLIQGYVLTGRHALFASYEAFIEIVSSMVQQYIKFVRIAQTLPWRGDCGSLTYILSSSGWRQEHNGFSHQNPSFISSLLQLHAPFVQAYFPADSTSTLVALHECLNNKNSINIIVAGKTEEFLWLTPEQAQQSLKNGFLVWDFASDTNPDIVLCGVGDYMTKEALAAISLLKKELPSLRLRFVNCSKLSGLNKTGPYLCSPDQFSFYFTPDKPVIFNFHGYPELFKSMLFEHGSSKRFTVRGYSEEGSTTTPFDMQIRNGTSRYHLVLDALRVGAQNGNINSKQAQELSQKYNQKISDFTNYILKYGIDPKEVTQWQWQKST
ncbi:phosphoketolase family protein [Candidatus Dependentiae bacterium]|nr:phosphoketolase family protein [Candidatus Dependentiae bacterium]